MDPDVARAKRRFHEGVIAGVTIVTNDLAGRAQRLAPIEEGTLRASADVEIVDDGNEVIGTVSFNEVYAAAQHEGVNFHHPKGGQAKYLEQPFLEQLPRYEAIIAASARRRMGT